LSLRMFEAKEGALLGKTAPTATTLKALDAQVLPSTQALVTTLRQAHAAALAAIKDAPGQVPCCLPPPTGQPVASNAPPPAAGRQLIEDGQQVHLENSLRVVRPEVDACYDVMLAKKSKARGRMVVAVDVETNGKRQQCGLFRRHRRHARHGGLRGRTSQAHALCGRPEAVACVLPAGVCPQQALISDVTAGACP